MLKNKQIENPLRGEHAILSFKYKSFLSFDDAMIHFSYIPDRDIIHKDVFEAWLKKTQEDKKTEIPENVAKEIIGTFYDKFLPFYATIDIRICHDSGAIQRLQAVKKQPSYEIPEELKALIPS